MGLRVKKSTPEHHARFRAGCRIQSFASFALRTQNGSGAGHFPAAVRVESAHPSVIE
jgi:hypothetical protein